MAVDDDSEALAGELFSDALGGLPIDLLGQFNNDWGAASTHCMRVLIDHLTCVFGPNEAMALA
eukprot:3033069-Alexandrium_andersonii.AAC.1